MKGKLSSRRALVIGLGKSGCAAARLLLHCGIRVAAVDENLKKNQSSFEVKELISQGLDLIMPSRINHINRFDLFVISPGIPQNNSWYRAARATGFEVFGEVELACRLSSQKMFAITGTNGKTTVTMMVEHVLKNCGILAKAVGNVGSPICDLLLRGFHGIAIVELSSFQLETMTTKAFDAAVLLNITADHLDRYASLKAYAQAKFRIQDCLKEEGKFFVEKKTATFWKRHFRRVYHAFGNQLEENIEYFLPVRYRGVRGYERENLVAAYSLCREAGVSPLDFAKALNGFEKPPHRVEFVRMIKGVAYFDDSKATNIDAVIKAVESLSGRVILIAGGLDKGLSYSLWKEAFKGKVSCICAIGQTAERMAQELEKKDYVKIFDSLEAAIKHAYELAKPGDNVLLSPGCSSFDMFRDYVHRGKEFKRFVQQL